MEPAREEAEKEAEIVGINRVWKTSWNLFEQRLKNKASTESGNPVGASWSLLEPLGAEAGEEAGAEAK